MPFTFSHPAIILPLIKFGQKRFSATALVAGSMAPDFEYFINMEMRQVHGHTIPGMFYYDLPITLALCFLFHYFVRDAFIRNFPMPLRKELVNFYGYEWNYRFKKHWAVIFYSALIGVMSHLFWDSFTHANRYFVELIPFLQERSSFMGGQLYNHDIAQILSSIIGGILILISVADLNQLFAWRINLRSTIYWLLVGVIMVFTIFIRDVQNISDIIATSIAGGLLGLMTAPFIIKRLNLEPE
ncbi:MAG: DUF4184 family protein [Crocinitomicaceae bacterium]|nr:DUF4184 family protein [Crocinitomicaceae bacterium]